MSFSFLLLYNHLFKYCNIHFIKLLKKKEGRLETKFSLKSLEIAFETSYLNHRNKSNKNYPK